MIDFKVLLTVIFQIWHTQHAEDILINSISYYFQVFIHQYWYAKFIFLYPAGEVQGMLTRWI